MKEDIILSKCGNEEILTILDFYKENNSKIAIELFINNHQKLMIVPQSMNEDKQNWLRRKRNSVLHFGMSTFDLSNKLNNEEMLLVNKYGLALKDYTLVPGSVPVKVEDVGIIGALTVTGLSPEEDHNYAINLLFKLMSGR